MRTFLLTVFWVTNFGNVIQLLIIISATWIILADSNSFLDLSLSVYVTQSVPWLAWVETILTHLLGGFGRWILSIPILIISPVKFVLGTIIGLWAYTTAKGMPNDPAYT